jgi:hydrocephalus-inducing protein
VEIAFEPTRVGDSFRDTLTLSSPAGGEYSVPLVGRCLAPKAQGPIDVSKGSGSVPFKNVFQVDADFVYRWV